MSPGIAGDHSRNDCQPPNKRTFDQGQRINSGLLEHVGRFHYFAYLYAALAYVVRRWSGTAIKAIHILSCLRIYMDKVCGRPLPSAAIRLHEWTDCELR